MNIPVLLQAKADILAHPDLDPKAVESAVFSADTESSALIAIYKMVYPNWDDIEKVGGPELDWPACNEDTWKRICRYFMDKTNVLNRTRHGPGVPATIPQARSCPIGG